MSNAESPSEGRSFYQPSIRPVNRPSFSMRTSRRRAGAKVENILCFPRRRVPEVSRFARPGFHRRVKVGIFLENRRNFPLLVLLGTDYFGTMYWLITNICDRHH